MEGRIQGRSGASRPGESAATARTPSGGESFYGAVAVFDADVIGRGAVFKDRPALEGEGQLRAAAPGNALDGSFRGGEP